MKEWKNERMKECKIKGWKDIMKGRMVIINGWKDGGWKNERTKVWIKKKMDESEYRVYERMSIRERKNERMKG